MGETRISDMNFYVFLYFCYYILCIGVTDATDNYDSEKCYQGINSTFIDLLKAIDKLNDVDLNVKIPPVYNRTHLEHLIEEYQNVESLAKKDSNTLQDSALKLDECSKNYTINKDHINNMLEKINNISRIYSDAIGINHVLNLMKKKYENLRSVYNISEEASNECTTSKIKYDTLVQLVNDLEKDYDQLMSERDNLITRNEEINRELQETNKEVLKNKADLDQLKIPTANIRNFLLEIEMKMNHSMSFLEENKAILEQLIKALKHPENDEKIKEKIEDLKDYISKLEAGLKIMNDSLNDFEKALGSFEFRSSLDEESINNIAEMKKEFDLLRDRIRKFREYLKNMRQQFINEMRKLNDLVDQKLRDMEIERKKWAEYEMLLNILPLTPEGIDKIKLELWKTRKTLNLLNKRDILKRQLENLTKICDEIDRYKTCPKLVELEN